MRILFWVSYPTEGASNRYRVEQYLPYLKKNAVKYVLHPFWGSAAFKILYKKKLYFKKLYFFILGVLGRILDIFQINRYDIVFIHRESSPLGILFFEKILSLIKKPFIFDFDDAIFLPSSSQPNSFIERFKNSNRIPQIIQLSSAVIAGNRYLAGFALKYNNKVFVIPTCIDTDKYYPDDKKIEHDEKIIIGWMGSVTTLDFLNILRGTFIHLCNFFPQITLKIIGGNFFVGGLNKIIAKPWLLDEELEDLRSFDIGIMSMPDNEWTRGKCGFKAILYMSMGIPCVCSPVGVNKEIVIDGVNGFWADTEQDWIDKLTLLIKNPRLRKEIGLVGRKTIEEKYSLKVNAPKLLEVLQQVYCQRNEEI